MSLESFVIDVIEGKKNVRAVKKFLHFSSLIFRNLIRLRHFAYDRGIFKVRKVDLPVVSVGNIVAGGTGKTPFVQLLTKELSAHLKVGIVSRGYRSEIAKKGRTLKISAEEGPFFNADVCGDEPYFLATRLHVPVWVGKNRVKSARLAKDSQIDLVVLDDGMQHRRLHRDIEIALIDAHDPFGKGHFLPRGYLRDFPQRLRYAHLIVINHIENEEHFEEVKAQITPFSHAPVIGTQLKVVDESQVRGKKVGVFCGIAKPRYFIEAVQEIAEEVVDALTLSDHQKPSLQKLEAFAKLCQEQGAEALVCTEKDAVKWPVDFTTVLPLISLPAQLEVVSGREHWHMLIEKIKQRQLQNKGRF